MAVFKGDHRLKVRYNECDSMGITYHARYLDWFVIGRTELLRAAGLSYAQMERSGLLLPVLEVRCRHHASTRYDDVIKLETRLLRVSRTRMDFGYRVFLETNEEAEDAPGVGGTVGNDAARHSGASPSPRSILAAEGETLHAFIDARHRPMDVKKRFPDVWDKLEQLAAL